MSNAVEWRVADCGCWVMLRVKLHYRCV